MRQLLRIAKGCLYGLPSFKQPIFILSAPRAGSSFLFERIHYCFLVWGSARENDAAWQHLFPYEQDRPTDYISIDAFRSRANAKQLKLALVHEFRLQRKSALLSYLIRRVFRRDSRFLDKTIANAFHLDVLHDVFRDARFIYLIRDGRATVSSMLESWKAGVFWKRPVPSIVGSNIRYWTFPFPPGWQEHVQRPLEEICAWSWTEHNRWILDSIERLGLESRVHVVRYEELLDDCDRVLSGIEQAFHLKRIAREDQTALKEVISWSTVSPPEHDKWKSLHGQEMTRIEPQIRSMATRLGYADRPASVRLPQRSPLAQAAFHHGA